MRHVRARAIAPLVLATAIALCGCASLHDAVAGARRANDAALAAAPWPENAAWIVVAQGAVSAAADHESALSVDPRALHRHVFRPAEAGDRRLTLAYHPGRAVVAGRAAADALGVTFRRDAHGTMLVVRDVRRIAADADATITLRVGEIGSDATFDVPVVVDPAFDGPFLVAPSVAERLRLRRHEIPGTADVHVALGRPFLATRARLRAAIPALGVESDVEAVVPR